MIWWQDDDRMTINKLCPSQTPPSKILVWEHKLRTTRIAHTPPLTQLAHTPLYHGTCTECSLHGICIIIVRLRKSNRHAINIVWLRKTNRNPASMVICMFELNVRVKMKIACWCVCPTYQMWIACRCVSRTHTVMRSWWVHRVKRACMASVLKERAFQPC